MKKLYEKLALFKAKHRLKNQEIVDKMSSRVSKLTHQTVTNWLSPERCPKKIKNKLHAQELVKLTDGYISMRDCGY